MNVLSIQAHHNSSVCLFIDGKFAYFNQEERLKKEKNYASIPFKCFEEVKKITKKIDRLVITGYNIDTNQMFMYIELLKYLGFEIGRWFFYNNSHHLSHAFRSFFASEFSESIVIVWDGRGSDYKLNDISDAYETTSVFHISYVEKPKLLYKKLYCYNSLSYSENLKPVFYKDDILESSDDFEFEIIKGGNHDIGHYYEAIKDYFEFGSNQAGKLMGLHSYGSKNQILSNLISDGKRFKDDLLVDNSIINNEKIKSLNLQNIIDLAYEAQKGVEKVGLNLIKKVLDKTKCKNLILTGGVSLNIVANSYYRENLDSDIDLYVDPLCGDEGNSIGIGQLYCYDQYGFLPIIEEKIYLCGNNPSYDFELEIGEEVFEDIEYSSVVNLLIEGKIVSIFQGKSEAGPRALGNRSILFDPRIRDGKDIVNRVKRREPFRPFACSILLEEAHKWFDMTHIKESPHMMYSFKALPGVKDIIPSVIHVDNTSRIQTVTQEQNYHYYNLIKEFSVKTNIPVLFNTSFNLAGETIVEDISDALSTLRRSELEYLYLPEVSKLIYIKNKEK
jgi:carbamoyltransferase